MAKCGEFTEGREVEPDGWVRVENCGRLYEGMFVVRASGRSMEPKILHPLNPAYGDIEMKDGDLVIAALVKVISNSAAVDS